MVPIYVIDFEGNKKNGICEFGVVKLERWQISEVKEEVDINNFDKNLEYFLSIRRGEPFETLLGIPRERAIIYQ